MNHKLWASVGARVVALTFVAAGLAACGERLSDTSSKTPKPTAASPSAVVIGQAPAEPQPDNTAPVGSTGNTAQTQTPAGTTEVSKSVESNSMPLPGQPNDHSNVAPKPSQHTDGQDALKSPAAAKQANNGEKQ